MTYSILFTETADKQLQKLSKDVQKRIIATLKRCQVRPYTHVKKLVGSDYFRLRIGDYRAILDIIDNKLVVLVVEVGHQ